MSPAPYGSLNRFIAVRRLWGGLIGLLLIGCVDGLQSRHPVVVSSDTLGTDDFVLAGSAIVQSMSNSPALNQQPPAVLQLGAVINGTKLSVESETLLARATHALLKSGRVVAWSESDDLKVKPELILRGRIYEGRNASNKLRGSGYYLRLTLVEVSTGAYLWSEERMVQQKPKPAVDAL